MHSRHPDVALNIVYNIYNQELLEQLALSHPSHKVRKIACERITNPHVLNRVVCFEKCYEIKKIAFQKIDKPEVFMDIANHSKNPHMAHAAIFQIPYEHILVDYIIDGNVFLEHYFPIILGRIKQKSNLKRIICNSNNIILCKYLINHIEDEDLLKSMICCDIEEKLVFEIKNRINTLNDKI